MSEGSSDGEGSSMDIWVPYKERQEWKDVQPVPQDDGPHPVIQIAYSDRCKDNNSYLALSQTFAESNYPNLAGTLTSRHTGYYHYKDVAYE